MFHSAIYESKFCADFLQADIKSLDLIPDTGSRYAEDPRCFGLIAVGLSQCVNQALPFDLFQAFR